ncbi:MAG TPA: hypothetical protein VGU26_07265, partial [Gaiellaceae bacterium]|nr:hypothetical protein [Gaiellaceae bacterium]
VSAVFRAIHEREGNTMHDFEAPDFVELAERAGFAEVHAVAEYRVVPSERVETWEVYENSSANPLVPTLREAADSVLTPDESERFRSHLRRQAEAGGGPSRGAVLYVWAHKR